MKKILLFTAIAIIGVSILLLLNEVLNYRKYLPKMVQQVETLQGQLLETQKNIFRAYEFQDFSLSSITNDTLSLQDKFILIFPEDICNGDYRPYIYGQGFRQR